MHHAYMLAALLATLLLSACKGGEPYLKPSADEGNRDERALSSSTPGEAEEEGRSVVVYVVADNLSDLPEPTSLFPEDREVHAGGAALEAEPAFIWRQEGEITRCYQAYNSRSSVCYQLAADVPMAGKGEILKKLIRKLFDGLSKSRKKGGKPAAPRPHPPAPAASNTKHLLGTVEAWRKPTLAPDKRIYPYRKSRGSTSPIPNLGLNRAGKTISDGKHTIRFDSNGFPRFNTKFEMLLDGVHVGTGNRQAHIRAANEGLSKAIRKDPGLARELGLSVDDVSKLPKSYQAPTGYRWHHHQDVGRMQLVKFEEHRLATPHTGGMAIWGGGYP